MYFLNIPCIITYRAKQNEFCLESPLFCSFVKTTFGDEYHENKDWFTYGCWEIFLHPFAKAAKAAGTKVHVPNDHHFQLIHRLYNRHVLPQLKKLLASNPNNRPHSYIFSLPYFVNEKGEWEIADERDETYPSLKRITYDKHLRWTEENANEYAKQVQN